MPYDTEPDAQYIYDFYTHKSGYWAQQQTLDVLWRDMVMRQAEARPDVHVLVGDTKKPRPLMMGYASQLVALNTNAMAQKPTLRFNPMSKKLTELRDIDRRLTPGYNAIWEMSQYGTKAWRRAWEDVGVYGRGMLTVNLKPYLWAERGYKKLASEYTSVVKQMGQDNSDLDYLSGQATGIEKAMAKYEREPQNFPIRMNWFDAHGALLEMNGDRPIPEGVLERKLTEGEFVNEFGEDSLPERYQSDPSLLDRAKNAALKLIGRGGASLAGSEDEITVLEYYNYQYYGCIVADKGAPALLKPVWEHGMGENPIVLFENELFPANPYGFRWRSTLFDYQDVLLALDTIISDELYQARRFTRGKVGYFIDAMKRMQSSTAPAANAMANPDVLIKDDPNSGVQVFHMGESVQPIPTPPMSEQVADLRNHLTQYAHTIALKPVEEGRLPNPQTSAVGMAIQLDQSKDRLHPLEDERSVGAKKIGRLFTMAIINMDKVYGGKITVHHNKHGEITLGASDVDGYSSLMEPVFSGMNMVNESQKLRDAQVKIRDIGMSPPTVMRDDLNVGNPHEEINNRRQYETEERLFQLRLQQLDQIMMQLAQKGMPANEAQELGEMLMDLPPEVLELAMAEGYIDPMQLQMPPQQQQVAIGPEGQPGGGTIPGSTGSVLQAESNVARARGGQLQGLSDLEAQELLV